MAVLLNHTAPQMRIFIPETGQYREFRGGKLEIDKGDPDYAVVMAEASRNPSIIVYESVTACPLCGEAFTGKTAAANLAKHKKDVHFSEYLAEKDEEHAVTRNAEVKAREGLACDACAPATFHPTAEALALHVTVMHAGSPSMDDEGNIAGERAAASTEIPAAKSSEG